MTYEQVKATLGDQMSKYMIRETTVMRNGKYTSGMHYKDGYVGMLFETIMEVDELVEEYAPITKADARLLIRAFNKLTASTVPDIWADSI
jgi:hypothetical protein